MLHFQVTERSMHRYIMISIPLTQRDLKRMKLMTHESWVTWLYDHHFWSIMVFFSGTPDGEYCNCSDNIVKKYSKHMIRYGFVQQNVASTDGHTQLAADGNVFVCMPSFHIGESILRFWKFAFAVNFTSSSLIIFIPISHFTCYLYSIERARRHMQKSAVKIVDLLFGSQFIGLARRICEWEYWPDREQLRIQYSTLSSLLFHGHTARPIVIFAIWFHLIHLM